MVASVQAITIYWLYLRELALKTSLWSGVVAQCLVHRTLIQSLLSLTTGDIAFSDLVSFLQCIFFSFSLPPSYTAISLSSGMSDWDLMMQKRKEAMARARRRRKRDIDITAVDDHIMAMIREMRQAVDVSSYNAHTYR